MKKSLKLLLLLFAFIFPMITYADEPIVSINQYSVQATKGSEVIVEFKGYYDMDGTLKYNKDELKYVSINVVNPSRLYEYEETGSLKITKNIAGELSFKYQELVIDGEYVAPRVETVQVKFEVLKVPDSKTITIEYYPESYKDITDGKKTIGSADTDIAYNIKIPVKLPDDKVTITDDTDLGNWQENPQPYSGDNSTGQNECVCPKNECPKCNCDNESSSEDNSVLLYASWGLSGLLLLILVVVLLKNKKPKIKE